MVASLATFQSGLICAKWMVLLLYHSDDCPWRGTAGCVRDMGEIRCSCPIHPMEVPQGQNHSWVVLHVRLHVLVDLVSPSDSLGQMLTLLITLSTTAAGTLTTIPTFKLSTSKASPTLATF